MTMADRALGTVAALLIVLGAAHRMNSQQAEAVEAPAMQHAQMGSYGVSQLPPQTMPVAVFSAHPSQRISQPSSQIPHTTIAQSSSSFEPPAAATQDDEATNQDYEDDATADEPTVIVDVNTPDPDVRVDLGGYSQLSPWAMPDQEVYDRIVGIMNNDERAAFTAEWLDMTPEERQDTLLRARIAMFGQ